MGAGRTETTRAIFGVKESGEVFLDGKKVSIHSPQDTIRAGIVLAPEDRKKDGLCTKLSIRHNIALPNLDLLCNRFGVISSGKESTMCDKAVANLKIKTPNLDIDAGNLSGGNQQKVVVGKWLARNSRVVMFDEPTRGIDVATKVEIYHLMNELKQQGIAVMFVCFLGNAGNHGHCRSNHRHVRRTHHQRTGCKGRNAKRDPQACHPL